MDLKEKQLLLTDLSARLFYNPWVQFNLEYGDNGHKEGSYRAHISSIDDPISGWLEVDYFETETLEKEWRSTIEQCKPYLRPMSSMTEEELYEVQEILGKGVEIHDVFISIVDSSINTFSYLELLAVFDWLNAHHFDYRGLIEKDLALIAPTGMYE